MQTILVVDDEAQVRETLRDMLEYLSYRVVQAADGREALEVYSKEPVDLIITDLWMPVMSGPELAEAIHSSDEGASTPVALLTGFLPPFVPDVSTFDSVFYKPVDMNELLSFLNEHLGPNAELATYAP